MARRRYRKESVLEIEESDEVPKPAWDGIAYLYSRDQEELAQLDPLEFLPQHSEREPELSTFFDEALSMARSARRSKDVEEKPLSDRQKEKIKNALKLKYKKSRLKESETKKKLEAGVQAPVRMVTSKHNKEGSMAIHPGYSFRVFATSTDGTTTLEGDFTNDSQLVRRTKDSWAGSWPTAKIEIQCVKTRSEEVKVIGDCPDCKGFGVHDPKHPNADGDEAPVTCERCDGLGLLLDNTNWSRWGSFSDEDLESIRSAFVEHMDQSDMGFPLNPNEAVIRDEVVAEIERRKVDQDA